MQILNGFEFSVKVLQLPRRLVDGEYIKQDADEFIKHQGPDAFERLLNGSENGVEFRIAQIAGKYDLKDDEARIAYCGEVSELLASLPGAVEREIYTGRAAEAAGITAEAMKLEVQRAMKRRAAQERKAQQRKDLNPAAALQPSERSLRYENLRSARAEEGLLQLLTLDASLFPAQMPVTEEQFSSPLLGRAFRLLWQQREAGRVPQAAALAGELEPRDRQLIHARQLNYDGTWDRMASACWSFVPLVEYQGGGEAATLEPLHEHLFEYKTHMMQNYGAGVQACYRGPRLYDTPETQAAVTEVIQWYKKYRDILNSDMIHLRRPDARDWDGFIHVNPHKKEKGLAMFFNPTHQEITRTIHIPLYYTGLTQTARIREKEQKPVTYKLNRDYTVELTVKIPANGYTWYVVEAAD